MFESTSPHAPTYPPLELDVLSSLSSSSSSSSSLRESIEKAMTSYNESGKNNDELLERRMDDHQFWIRQFLKQDGTTATGSTPPHQHERAAGSMMRNGMEIAFYDYVTKFQMGLEEQQMGNYESAQSHLFSSLLARMKLRGHDHWTVAEAHIFLRALAYERGDVRSANIHEREVRRIGNLPNARIRFLPPFDTLHIYHSQQQQPPHPSQPQHKQEHKQEQEDQQQKQQQEHKQEQEQEDQQQQEQDRKQKMEAATAPGAAFVPFNRNAGRMVTKEKIDAAGKPIAFDVPVESEEFNRFRTELDRIANDDRDTQTKIVLDFMATNPDDVDVQACGMSTLWELHGIMQQSSYYSTTTTTSSSSSSSQSKHQIFRIIINGMKANMEHSSDVQYYGCGALWSMAVNMDDLTNIVQADGCESAVHALTIHSSQEEHVARTALGLIKTLSSDVLGHARLQSSNATKAVASTMIQYHSNIELQKTGCAILANLAIDFSTTKDANADFTNEINAIVNAMTNAPNHTTIHQHGLLALSNSAKLDPTTQSTITSPQVLSVIVQCMNTFEDNETIQDRACEVLWFSIRDDDLSRINIAFAGASQRVLKTLQLFTNKSLNVVQAAMGLIQTLSIEEDCKAQLKQLGVKAVILNAMTVHKMDPQIQESGCHVLANLAFSRDNSDNNNPNPDTTATTTSSNNKRKVDPVGLETIDCVASVLDIHGHDRTIVLSACAALNNFAFLDANVELMIRSSSYDILRLIREAIERYPEDCGPKTKRIMSRLERYRRTTTRFS